MKKPVQYLLFSMILILATQAYSQSSGTPGLEFVVELRVTTDKVRIVGQTPYGERRIIPITGGTFEGPGMKGVVLPGGADYQFVNSDNTRTSIEAIYSIQTEDGFTIHIRNRGVVYITENQLKERMDGKPFDWEQIYFRAAPVFDAPIDSPYNWLNNAIFVCKGVPGGDGNVSIIVWKVL